MMKTSTLAPVYLDRQLVGLMGDPRPLVSKIVVAGGKRPESVRVLVGRGPDDERGRPVALDTVIDRTADPTIPIYLTCVATSGLGKPGPSVSNLRAPDANAIPPQYVEFPGKASEPAMPGPLPPIDPDPSEPERPGHP